MRHLKITAIILFVSLAFTSCDEVFDLLTDDPRDAFTGDWKVEENNTLKAADFYNVTIVKSSSDSTAVLIKNFYAINISTSIKATVSGGNVTIPLQTVAGYTFNGYGTIALNDKSIDWAYTVNHNNGFIDQVTATYTREN